MSNYYFTKTSSLSIFYLTSFQGKDMLNKYDQIFTFSSIYQWFLFNKALLFNYDDIASEILEKNQINDLKKLDKKIIRVNKFTWDIWENIVLNKGIRLFYSQNDKLRENLIGTYPKKLIYVSKDEHLGVNINGVDFGNKKKWKGENILGNLLIKNREFFINELIKI